mgnify:CR=1 FL=1
MKTKAPRRGILPWRPQRRFDGSVEIYVNFYHPVTMRITSRSLTPQEYLAMWDESALQFQKEGKSKPEHLPTREQVEEFLAVPQESTPKASVRTVQPTVMQRMRPAVLPTVRSRIPVTVERMRQPAVRTRIAQAKVDMHANKEPVLLIPEPETELPTLVIEQSRSPEKSSISTEYAKSAGVVNKPRRKFDEKMVVLEAVASELRTKVRDHLRVETGKEPLEDHVQITVSELLTHSAARLAMGLNGVRSFFHRSVPLETRKQWLYGPSGCKRFRSTIKFEILMHTREELRNNGGQKPRKKELAEAAAQSLGMTLKSTNTYVYEKLTPKQREALDLRKSPLTAAEKVEILLRVLDWMKKEKYPQPRMMDLAREAAPFLHMKSISTFSLIRRVFNEERRRELGLAENTSGAFIGISPDVVREGLLGAFAVLRLKQRRPTLRNLRIVLVLARNTVQRYLDRHPDIAAMVEKDDSS